ncbi:hypothetical protein D6810_00165 [Candidatus Dojkabacteria bacterium]|uniref:NusB/RsmB/TIM44 domain-containing protein n=1 Tax=Candidatus Dojkabacteria bacterium TaxID=2099670 RepID=A0A3M0Z001_9BACT|nr:MAG: hypothetical protein D6810_00165 [Candidatus Dojkabacteria bacterium]
MVEKKKDFSDKFFKNHLSRLLSVQYIYTWIFLNQRFSNKVSGFVFEPESLLELMLNDFTLGNRLKFNKNLYFDILSNFEYMVPLVNKKASEIATERPIEEICPVTRSIWYCIITEVDVLKHIPPLVAIDEAIELEKQLNAGEMYGLTNAFLGKYFGLS